MQERILSLALVFLLMVTAASCIYITIKYPDTKEIYCRDHIDDSKCRIKQIDWQIEERDGRQYVTNSGVEVRIENLTVEEIK